MSWLKDLFPPVVVPAGKCGVAEVTKFTVDQHDAAMFNLRSMVNGAGHRAVSEGDYTRLTVNGVLMMSDTPAEMRDHVVAVRQARGHCLVFGLGLGLVANAMAAKPEVTKVTVVELEPDVIDLIAPHLHRKVEVVQCDALKFKPGKGERWDVVWADIWPDISTDNRSEMTLFKRRFGRRCKWIGVWADDEVLRLKRQERKRGWW